MTKVTNVTARPLRDRDEMTLLIYNATTGHIPNVCPIPSKRQTAASNTVRCIVTNVCLHQRDGSWNLSGLRPSGFKKAYNGYKRQK